MMMMMMTMTLNAVSVLVVMMSSKRDSGGALHRPELLPLGRLDSSAASSVSLVCRARQREQRQC